jgi:molybdopterin/thiamine biosynthesis adenylyltransferase
MLWVIESAARFLQERAAIHDLAGQAAWIQALRWGFTKEAMLKVDIDLAIGDETYDVELIYPNLFPDTPAYIRPRTSTARWSQHQYGPGGVLCLEWGPDNWSPEITGADLLRSTHKLLSTEGGHHATTAAVPSRHNLTFGQEVRSSTRRIVFTPAFAAFLSTVPLQTQHGLVTRSIFHDSAVVLFISEILRSAGDAFQLPDLPLGVSSYGPLFPWRGEGWLFKSDAFHSIGRVSSVEALLTVIRDGGFADFTFSRPAEGKSGNTEDLFLLAGRDGGVRAVTVDTSGEQTVREYAVVDAGDSEEERLPAEHHSLSEKRVGIVGLGSVGSKVAVSLARSGVRRFLLVDDDVMLTPNICRHELDWASVGVNKVDGVEEALSLVAPGIDVQTRRTRIAGQESAKSASTALDSLAACDLLIDATANPSVFVQLAAIAKRRKKPLIWGEVFAGGIGALLARSRPDRDPLPLTMRAGIHQHLQTLPKAPFPHAGDYDVVQDAIPLVAFDAEVSQFAAVLTSFALDTLLDRALSAFPYSAYLIGFKRGWIFDAPFDTRPILVEAPVAETTDSPSVQVDERQQAAAVLIDLINQQINADASTPR